MDLYGLIGYPLGHSFSKQYFTEKFQKEQLKDCFFEAYPIKSIDEFPSLINDNPSLKGMCVTIPYKEQILKYVTAQSEEVKSIGAANSIKISGGQLTAYNTDIIGFEKSFITLLCPHHKKALILGSGGASKAVQFVLNKLGIEFLIVSRSKGLSQKVIDYTMVKGHLRNGYNVIINTSPVGMFPNEHECPDIPYEVLTSDNYLFDLVYKPLKTLFLKKGEGIGAQIQNGFSMLTIQAEASWEIWNNF